MTLRDPAKIAESRSRKVINKRLDIDLHVHVQPYMRELSPVRSLRRCIPRRILLQDAHQTEPGRRYRYVFTQHDILGCDFATIDLFVRLVIGAKRRALERYASKQAARAGITEDLRPQVGIGVRGSVTALRACRGLLFPRRGDVHEYDVDARRVHQSKRGLDFQSRSCPHGQWIPRSHGQRRASV
jgi:hypothetical protein